MDLCQKDENTDDIIANASAAIWYRDYLFIKKKLGQLVDSVLTDGTEIKIKVAVEYSEKYGLKLIVKDIDPTYTIGQNELSRQKLYERLQKENITNKNSELSLPIVLQKIAVISSETAAGYQDFQKQLEGNQYGYQYKVDLFQSAVQGIRVESEVSEALNIIKESNDYDCVCIIRGGGSKLDLSWFDNYKIAKTISDLQIPVIVGIGHDIDQTITDLVSHTSVKTPTAVADFIIDHNLSFEQDLLYKLEHIQFISKEVFNENKEQIARFASKLEVIASHLVQLQSSIINEKFEKINRQIGFLLAKEKEKLNSITKVLEANNPQNVLKKGYSIVTQNKQIIKSFKDLSVGQDIEIEFSDGKTTIKQK